jgi:lipopolysaccharide cholinephosphotransferase
MAITQENHRLHQQALHKLLVEFDRVCRLLDIPYVLFAGTLLGAVRHQGFIPWDDDLDVMMLRADYDRFLSAAPTVLHTDDFHLQGEFSAHWPMFFSKLRLNNTTCLEKFHPKDEAMHQGIYIDIFPCDNAAPTALGRRMQFLASKVIITKALDARGYDTDSRGKKIAMALCRLLPTKPFLRLAKRGRADSTKVHSFFAAARRYDKNVYPRDWFTRRTEGVFEGGTYPIPADYDGMLTTLYGDYRTLPPPEERVCKQHALLVDTQQSYEVYQGYRDGMTFDVYTRSIR